MISGASARASLSPGSKGTCATTLVIIAQNETLKVGDKTIKLINDIPVGHKFSLAEIQKGEKIIKYGEIIGVATQNIQVGEWIHIHNIKSYYLELYKDG